jgi:hypothetical protein
LLIAEDAYIGCLAKAFKGLNPFPPKRGDCGIGAAEGFSSDVRPERLKQRNIHRTMGHHVN